MSTTPSAATYERRIVSVVFADLVGFTTLSERLDPEDVAAIQDRYFGAVRAAVDRYRGVLEKFIGDAAMAAFGVPRAADDDAERAVRCGLAIVAAVERLDAELGLEPGVVAVRVGIATGEVVYADSGPDAGRLTGDVVNTAARLQAAASPGVTLLSAPTALSVAEAIELGPTLSLRLKGKAEPVLAQAAVGARAVRSREAAMGDLRAPMLGRDTELRTLLAALDRTRGVGRSIGAAAVSTERWLIVAPPGTGKTRLLDELSGRAPVDVAVRRARFRPTDPRPFGVIAELASDLADDHLTAADRQARLIAGGLTAARAAVVGEAFASLSGSTTSDLAAIDRETRFAAWLDGLDALGTDRGELWIVEDAHWAGRDALDFLDAAHERPTRGGRLVVVSTRPSLLERATGWSADHGPRRRLDLGGLTATSAEALVGALVGDAIPEPLRRRIAHASDGNCLFIEELLRTWVSVGILVREGSAWRMTSPGESITIPATVHAVYGAQLDDLPPAARSAARRAAVAGRRFPADALPDLGVVDPIEALASLDRRSLISGPTQQPLTGPSYTYRHALLHDAAYASLARAERAVLHVALARWLEAAATGRADEIAESIGGHYEAALRSAPALAPTVSAGLDRDEAMAEAARWLERAAEHAVRQAADEAAASLFRRALELTPVDAPLDAARRWLGLGRSLRRAGRSDEAAEAFEQSVKAALDGLAASAPIASDWQLARASVAKAGTALSLLRFEQLEFLEASRLADRLIAEIGPADDVDTAILAVARSRARSGETNETADWVADASRALAIVRTTGDRRLELETLVDLAAAHGEAGLPAIDDWLAVRTLAADLDDPEMEVRGIANAASYQLDERPADIRAAIEPARAIATAWGLVERLAWIDYLDAEAGLAIGAWDVGLASGMAALDRGERHALHRVCVRTLSAILPMAGATGRRDVLVRGHDWYQAAAERSLPESPYGRVLHASAAIWFARAGLRPAHAPDPGALLDGFALEPSGPAWLACLATILAAWRDVGDLGAVRNALAASLEAQRRTALPSTLASGALEVELATLEAAAGADADRIAVIARRSLSPLRQVGAAWWIARALRVLEGAGEATTEERTEAAAIERRLGLVGAVEG